jgi:regulator of sigma E protease
MSTTLLIEIFQFVGALAALIIIHELGHFLVARWLGIEVEEFGLGFPPRLVTLFKSRETLFTLNAIPLGGFVRPKGENDPNVPGGLAAASPWVRLAVTAAGPFSNLLLGAILSAIIISNIGVPIESKVQIMEVVPGSPADTAGLTSGDLILRVNEKEVTSMETLSDEIRANLDKPTQITYQRGDQVEVTTLTPRSNPPEGQGAIGIVMTNPSQPVNLISAIPLGVQQVFSHIRELLGFAGGLISGQTPAEEGRLVGFKGMFDMFQVIRRSEPLQPYPAWLPVVGFFTTITISLGLLNLLPIPALDGGRILFILPEIVLRRRIPPQYENVINLVSFALLLVLLLYINLQDFINPISIP